MSYFGSSRFASRLPYSDITRITKRTGALISSNNQAVQQKVRWSKTVTNVPQGNEQALITARLSGFNATTNTGAIYNKESIEPIICGARSSGKFGGELWKDITQITGSKGIYILYAPYIYYWICEHEDVDPEDITKEIED